MDELTEIQDWYHSQCNGDWEHQYGVKIDTLDNPGWSVIIDLKHTILATKPFKINQKGNIAGSIDDDPDWYSCKVENHQFMGYGGATHLKTILRIFLNWKNSCSAAIDNRQSVIVNQKDD